MEQGTQTRQVRIIPASKKEETSAGNPQAGRKRVAAYCRVSTDSEEQLTSYTAQKEYYTQLIEKNPDWELVSIFADQGISGTSLKKRKEFNRMITACKRGRIDLILTKSLSRFARNTVDCLETVRMLKAQGIGVIFEKENINTMTESSEFLITLFSSFAQAESESISRNVAWGMQKSMQAGHAALQYSRLLGYKKGADGKPEIVPEEAEIVRRIYRRYLAGCSLGQIKRELEADQVPTASGIKAWSGQVIKNILTSEKYIGDVLLQKTFITDCITKTVKKNQGERPMYYIEDHHPAIISKEIFNMVREEMARRNSKRKVMQKTGRTEQGKYSYKYALSELLICGECGTPYKRCTWARNGKKRIVWRCISRLEYGTKYCHNSPTLDEEKLHAAILSALNEMVMAANEIVKTAAELVSTTYARKNGGNEDQAALQERLSILTTQQEELLDKVLEDMDNAELNASLKAVTEERQKLLVQIQAAKTNEQQQDSQQMRLDEFKSFIRENAKGFTEYNDEVTRRVIEKITILDSKTIRIRFKGSDIETEHKLPDS